MKRRDFLRTAAAAAAAAPLRLFADDDARPKGVGMCDWTMGCAANPACFEKAAGAGLSGVQVSVGTTPESIPLRSPAVRQRYRELSAKHGVHIHSVAAGGILNQIPLKSEPQSAVYVIDALEAAAALGADNILMAFFGSGDLRQSADGKNFTNVSDGGSAVYALDQPGVDRVVAALRQIVPRAEAAGVTLGLENTLTARQNLEIIERVGSPLVQVYYDMGNSTHYGYDVPAEIRLLGKRICEMHIKDWGAKVFGRGEGEVDMPAVAAALRDIGYDRWMCLETAGEKNRFVEDTRANVAFAKTQFGIR